MLAIAFRFPAGRYHATPWGRHVNEAEVEWPPAPWRLARALIATWHRKADPVRYPEAVLERLVERLASFDPVYHLPPAVHAHSRHYMPQGRFKGGREETALVFDAFVRVEPDAELVMAWPQLDAPDDELTLLDALLRDLGFLGRAESWVDARRLEDWTGEPNCYASELAVDTETGEAMDPVRLIAPLSPEEYGQRRQETFSAHGLDTTRSKKAQKQIIATLPERLIDALAVDTGPLQRAGWSCPPAARFLTYQRPANAFSPSTPSARRGHRARPSRQATSARLALSGKPLPRIEDALRIGELTRMAAMKKAEGRGAGPVPGALSGHDLLPGNRHGHAFYLPEDADGDGHIDHVLVHAPDGLPLEAVRALDSITRLWQRDGGEWQVLFEGHGTMASLGDSMYAGRGCRWVSVTPYLHPWHAKKRFGISEQIARECRERGLTEPQVTMEQMPFVGSDGRSRRSVHFHRFRDTRKRQTQPDTRGHFLTLTFPQPIDGPTALGFGCHFGLGMFRPLDELK